MLTVARNSVQVYTVVYSAYIVNNCVQWAHGDSCEQCAHSVYWAQERSWVRECSASAMIVSRVGVGVVPRGELVIDSWVVLGL